MAYTHRDVTATLESRLALDPHARFRRFEDEGVIIQQTTAEAIVINATGARLLELVDGARSLADCARALEGEFEAPGEVVARDVVTFANELLAAGVARVV